VGVTTPAQPLAAKAAHWRSISARRPGIGWS
jgi:hypothetical protein